MCVIYMMVLVVAAVEQCVPVKRELSICIVTFRLIKERRKRERERRGGIDARMKESTEHFGREAEIDAIGNRGNDAADSMFGVRGIFGARGGPSITLPNHHFFRAFLSRAASNEYIMYKRYTSISSFCLPQLRLNSLFALVVIATALSSPLPS